MDTRTLESAAASGEFISRVAADTDVDALAESISFAVMDGKKIQLRAIGSIATTQLVRAVAIARGIVASRNYELAIRPYLFEARGSDGVMLAGIGAVVVHNHVTD